MSGILLAGFTFSGIYIAYESHRPPLPPPVRADELLVAGVAREDVLRAEERGATDETTRVLLRSAGCAFCLAEDECLSLFFVRRSLFWVGRALCEG